MALKKGNFTIGALVAASAGYVIGVLTAPKSGRETRKNIAQTASKTKTEGEKQLKKLHSELAELLEQTNRQKIKAGAKASKELREAADKAKIAKEKARLLLSALHNGDADDPNLRKAIVEAQKAKTDLIKFLKK